LDTRRLDIRTSVDLPRRWFYGWVMLALAILLMVATSPGQTYGVTFFNAEFRAAFDLSHTKLSSIYLIATLLAALVLPMCGGLVDQYGLKNSTVFAVAMMAMACAFASQVRGSATLMIAFVMLRALGSGTLVLLANNTLAAWFDRRLGFAIGLMQLAMAVAMMLVPAGFVVLIKAWGWRGAYLALALIIAGTLLPLIVFGYRRTPGEIGQFPDGDPPPEGARVPLSAQGMSLHQAMRQPVYWVLLAATGIWGLVGSGLMFHLETIFRLHGFSTSDTLLAIRYFAVSMAIMQVLGGVSADLLPMRWIIVTPLVLLASCTALLACNQPEWLTTGCILFGMAQGLMTIVAGTAWARIFGRCHLGKIRATSITAGVGGSSIGPLLLGASIDRHGSVAPSLWLFAAGSAAVGFAAFWMKPPKRHDVCGGRVG
jgi:OFA family oxalate/formate antiporter-like MFS transporter